MQMPPQYLELESHPPMTRLPIVSPKGRSLCLARETRAMTANDRENLFAPRRKTLIGASGSFRVFLGTRNGIGNFCTRVEVSGQATLSSHPSHTPVLTSPGPVDGLVVLLGWVHLVTLLLRNSQYPLGIGPNATLVSRDFLGLFFSPSRVKALSRQSFATDEGRAMICPQYY